MIQMHAQYSYIEPYIAFATGTHLQCSPSYRLPLIHTFGPLGLATCYHEPKTFMTKVYEI